MTDVTNPAAPADAVLADPQSPWILLSQLPGMGARRWQAIKDHLDSPLELLTLNAATLASLNLPVAAREPLLAWQAGDLKHPAVAEVLRIHRACERHGLTLVPWASAAYPALLASIHDAPLLLYVRGDAALLHRPQLGIVGSRQASRAGLDHARAFATALARAGYLITSGLALGIDGAAHLAALEAGEATLAVVGTGLDISYPARHRALTERIASAGAVVSDLPPGSPARAAHFPQRNRIISGLSRGVLVVEASPRSGSLITARLALEQGREVFAIPGSIHNAQARGCHQLIRQGATLVETVADIEAELEAWERPRPVARAAALGRKSPQPPPVPQPAPPSPALQPDLSGLGKREIAVMEALGYDPASTDALCAATGLAAEQLMQSLLLLEMEGLVDSAPGGFQRLV
ncbi:MAG: DNA-processing protein DprA [Marinobacter sp.]|uniref:DNA-processing protein DprA n=1 Tax=Marinobacter sp. TaxID=50741 RepID=UPI00299E7DA6|nr:DNA-processing protein DprA [Marinobacter sp.]MDX1634130.1 DNA-processing protein DprA [Marinobacter sp.]